MIGGVAHGFIAGLLALLSWPERSSGGAFLLMTEPLSGALAALRGFRRRWAEPEPGWVHLAYIRSLLTAVGLDSCLLLRR